MYLTASLLTLASLTQASVQDIRLGVQMCDGVFGQNAGEIRHTPWLVEDNGGWSDWASDHNYRNPDGVRLGIFGKLSQTGRPFELNDLDLRLCIQLTDRSNNEDGNKKHEGVVRCTPWVSEGAGWSKEWASDRNWRNYDAARVQLETRQSPIQGLVIRDLQVGLRATDRADVSKHMGQPQFTQWLVYNAHHSFTWSNYAGDRNFRNADSLKVFLRADYSVEGETRITPMAQAVVETPMIEDDVHYEYKAYSKPKASHSHKDLFFFAAAGCVVLNLLVLAVLACKKQRKVVEFE